MAQVPQHSWTDLFVLDVESGVLVWKTRPIEHFKTKRDMDAWNTRFAGTKAGASVSDGRLRVAIGGSNVYLHRIVYEMYFGDIPSGFMVDHRDTNFMNNRPDNLRLATRAQNNMNSSKRKSNTSGFKGVHWDARKGKHIAQINHHGKRIHVGTFSSPEEAHAAYSLMATKLHGDFARTI